MKFNGKLKNNLFIIFAISTIIIIILSILVAFIIKHKYDNVKIEDDYYAVLNGGAGEIINHTYLYIENGHYKYIQTQAFTTHWGSSEWKEKITKTGKLNTLQEVIEISKQNASDGWVQINVDIKETENNKAYKKGDIITIDELKELISLKQNK